MNPAFLLGTAFNIAYWHRKYHSGTICKGVSNPQTSNALSGCEKEEIPKWVWRRYRQRIRMKPKKSFRKMKGKNGILLFGDPENQNFYNISITLHGFLMIFFLVMPGLFGGFGNYFQELFTNQSHLWTHRSPFISRINLLKASLSYPFIIYSHRRLFLQYLFWHLAG